MDTTPALRSNDGTGDPSHLPPHLAGPDTSAVPAWKLLLRGLIGRCPVCGSRHVFVRWLQIGSACPRCGFNFERESGWWLGAMTMNIGGAMVVWGLFFVLGMVLTWPDVPWTLLTIGGLVLMALFPLLFAPASKTLWLALDILLNRWK